MLGEWWDSNFIFNGTAEAELIGELDQRSDDLVVEKNTYSAFRNTRLEVVVVRIAMMHPDPSYEPPA